MSTISGLVLAGGLSRRMGVNKLLLRLDGQRLIDRALTRLQAQCPHVLVNVNEPLENLDPALCIPDDIPGHQGPLAGIAAGLSATRARFPDATHILTIAGDTPFFPGDLAANLAATATEPNQIIVAADMEGRWHPTFALWPLTIESDLRRFLADPANRRVRAFVERHPHTAVSFPLIPGPHGSIEPFFNINTPEDYRQALQFLGETE